MTPYLQCIDSHAHLDDARFQLDLPTVLERSSAQGVVQTLTVATNVTTSEASIALANTYPSLFATVGIHPHEAAHADLSAFEEIRRLAASPKVVGIGETGLDYHYDFSPKPIQRECFSTNIQIARQCHLPLVIHIREAHDDIVSILHEGTKGAVLGVVHCFTGNLDQARQYLDLGLYISFAGMITFPNAHEIRKVAAWAPRDRILIETDAPYLAPVPHRGRRNEPSYLLETCRTLAKLRGQTAVEIATITAENARVLFGLKCGLLTKNN